MTAIEGARTDARRRCYADDFDDREFRTTMGMFATGVTVVTSPPDPLHGMTANAFASLSKDPPLVLVCVDRTAIMHQRILTCGAFGVSVLSAAQEDLARHFADQLRPDGVAQFERVAWQPGRSTGAPLLAGAIAWLECDLVEAYTNGDHSIFVGSVLDLSRNTGSALLFFGGKFYGLGAK